MAETKKGEPKKLSLIRPMDFCVVSSNDLEGSELKLGQEVVVAATHVAPEKRSDPYLQRVYMAVIKIEDNRLLLPTTDNEEKTYIVDPRKLTHVSKERQAELVEAMGEQYGRDAAETNT